MCTGVVWMSVRFNDNWAIPYSSMYQPMPFTALSEPGMRSGSPLASFTIGLPGPPVRFTRPDSRMSKAMALARRELVVFRLML